MFQWFRNLKIRSKLIAAFIAMIIFSLIVSLTALIYQHQVQEKSVVRLKMENRMAELNAQTEIALLMARRAEKDYLLRYKDIGLKEARIKYVNRVKEYVQKVYKHIQEIEKLETHSEHTQLADTMNQSISEYETTFMKVVDLIEKHGFKDTGIEGKFRKEAHTIEEFVNEKGLESLERDMLIVRRHEKDFLLRGDGKYVNQLLKAIKHLKIDVDEHAELNGIEKGELTKLLDNYQIAFSKLVQVDKQIVDSIKIYRAAAHELEPLFDEIASESQEHKQEVEIEVIESNEFVMISVITLSIIVMAINILIAIFLANWISKPLHLIVQGSQLLVSGNTKLQGIDQSALKKIAHNQDEIGKIAHSFDSLSVYFKEIIDDIVQVSSGLAKGNLSAIPQANYKGDFLEIKIGLEKSLLNLRLVIADIVQMSQRLAAGNKATAKTNYQGDFVKIKESLEIASAQLLEAKIKNDRESWLKTGQAKLNELMRGEQKIDVLAKKVISFLTPYSGGQFGLFYIMKNYGENNYLELIANYAYVTDKNMILRFQIGEGLVGQAALDKKMLIFEQKQEKNLTIQRSGLGNIRPRYVLFFPLLYEGNVKGVIEIGASKPLSDSQRDFLTQAMSIIAITVNTAESQEKMEMLLEQSQRKAKQ